MTVAGATHTAVFAEHDHGDSAAHRDHNIRAAVIHVIADAAVSVLVIVGLILARVFGWLWMDPLAGIIGACVIASWAYGLVRDTAAILLDMNPDREMSARLRAAVEQDGDRLTDLHLWRLGPGHFGAILSVATIRGRGVAFYRARLAGFKALSHLTIEIEPQGWRWVRRLACLLRSRPSIPRPPLSSRGPALVTRASSHRTRACRSSLLSDHPFTSDMTVG